MSTFRNLLAALCLPALTLTAAADAPTADAPAPEASAAENSLVEELRSALAEMEASGESMEALAEIGDLYARLGDAQRAVIAFERAIANYGGTEQLYFRLALVLLAAGRGELGLETLKIGAAAFPESADLQAELGKAYVAFGKQYAAISAFSRARAIDPSNESYVYELADIYRWQGKYDRALAILGETVGGEDVAPPLAMLHADVLIGSGDERQAVRVMEALFEKHPESGDVRRMLAHAYQSYAMRESQAGRLTRAIRTIESSLEILPEDFNAIGSLGMLHYEAGDHAKAETIFRDLAEQHPEFLDGHAMYGTLLRTQDRTEEAKKAFREGLARARQAKDQESVKRFTQLLSTF